MAVFVYAARCAEGEEHEAAYRLLAYAAASKTGSASLPRILREEGGKPFFPDYPALCFNLSHSYGAVVCALHDEAVGVDIEKIRSAPRRLAGGMDDRAFFLSWTAKEATVKRRGQGVGALLRDMMPDPLCRSYEDVLPGWIITVCPSRETEIITAVIDAARLG